MSKDIVKNYGKSIRSKLLNIAKNEDVYYQTVLTRYFQERLVYRISQTGYRQNFYLKGGAFVAFPNYDHDFQTIPKHSSAQQLVIFWGYGTNVLATKVTNNRKLFKSCSSKEIDISLMK